MFSSTPSPPYLINWILNVHIFGVAKISNERNGDTIILCDQDLYLSLKFLEQSQHHLNHHRLSKSYTSCIWYFFLNLRNNIKWSLNNHANTPILTSLIFCATTPPHGNHYHHPLAHLPCIKIKPKEIQVIPSHASMKATECKFSLSLLIY